MALRFIMVGMVELTTVVEEWINVAVVHVMVNVDQPMGVPVIHADNYKIWRNMKLFVFKVWEEVTLQAMVTKSVWAAFLGINGF